MQEVPVSDFLESGPEGLVLEPEVYIYIKVWMKVYHCLVCVEADV